MGPMRAYCEIRHSTGGEVEAEVGWEVDRNGTGASLSRLSGKKPLDMWGGRSMQLAISV
jgi:hypothetical protein